MCQRTHAWRDARKSGCVSKPKIQNPLDEFRSLELNFWIHSVFNTKSWSLVQCQIGFRMFFFKRVNAQAYQKHRT